MDASLKHSQTVTCPRCSTANAAHTRVCKECRAGLTATHAMAVQAEDLQVEDAARTEGYVGDSFRDRPNRGDARESLRYLLLGLALSPVFAFLPYLQFFDWFLTSLFHESGHCFFAWMTGHPAFPAISLSGHAAAMHQDQSLLVAVGVFGGLAFATWHSRERRLVFWSLCVATVLQPVFAFTSAKEVLFLLGGHLGELSFGAICMWRALQGGFTQSKLERLLYSVLGWYLVGHNLWMCGGLIFSEAARQTYGANGSFGLANDYIRLAHDELSVSLPAVAAFMLLVSLLPVPLAIFVWRKHP